jgi:hypothetical protein
VLLGGGATGFKWRGTLAAFNKSFFLGSFASCANMGLVGLRQADRLFVQLERDAVFPTNRLEQRLYHYRPSRRIIAVGMYTRVPINEQGNFREATLLDR